MKVKLSCLGPDYIYSIKSRDTQSKYFYTRFQLCRQKITNKWETKGFLVLMFEQYDLPSRQHESKNSLSVDFIPDGLEIASYTLSSKSIFVKSNL